MDADTRHQLKHNELADMLTRLRDLDNPSTRYTLLFIAAVLAVYVAWSGWSYAHQRSIEQSWQRLGSITAGIGSGNDAAAATALTDLRALIAEDSDPVLGGYARLMLAEHRITEAFEKPEERQAAFTEAKDVLEKTLKTSGTPPMLEAATAYALANTYESLAALNDAERASLLDKASALYTRITTEKRFDGSPYFELSQDHLDTMAELATPVVFVPGMPEPPAADASPTKPSSGIQAFTADNPEELRRMIQEAQAKQQQQPVPPPQNQAQPAPEPTAEPADTPSEEPAAEPASDEPTETPSETPTENP